MSELDEFGTDNMIALGIQDVSLNAYTDIETQWQNYAMPTAKRRNELAKLSTPSVRLSAPRIKGETIRRAVARNAVVALTQVLRPIPSSSISFDFIIVPMIDFNQRIVSVEDFRDFLSIDAMPVAPSTLDRRQTDKPLELKSVNPAANQRELPLSGHFVPSDALLAYWVTGLNAINSESDIPKETSKTFDVSIDSPLLRKEFHKALFGAIARYALLESYRRNKLKLSINKRFLYSFETAIYNSFCVAPSDASYFFEALGHELENWLRSGRVISGSWGAITVDASGDFILMLKRRQKVTTRGFVATSFT
jgi:hypothetical protein